jgi:hypothetical protein
LLKIRKIIQAKKVIVRPRFRAELRILDKREKQCHSFTVHWKEEE